LKYIASQPRIFDSMKEPWSVDRLLARIIHEASTATADPGISTALRYIGLLDVQSSTSPGLSESYIFITWREAPSATPVCDASLRTFMNNAG
jgi:hypothetical protein